MARAAQKTPKQKVPVPDFSSYSYAKLAKFKQAIDGEIQSRKQREVEELRKRVNETAQTLGMSVTEIIGLPGSGRRQTNHAKGKQPARYRGPGGELWSGRGPAPRWMKPFLAKGKSKEDFLIKQ